MRSRISWLLSKTQNWKMCRSISGRIGISQDEEFWSCVDNNVNRVSNAALRTDDIV